MNTYSRSHLSDATLLSDLKTHVAGERTATAELLADIAEVDDRKLYLPAGYDSMFAYCVEELRLSDDAAYARIQVARAARQFPAIFVALEEGRVYLTAVRLLAPHLTPANVDELLGAATHRRKSEIEALLARRFPQAETRPIGPVIRPLVSAPQAPAAVADSGNLLVLERVDAMPAASGNLLAPAQVDAERLLFQLMIRKRTQQKWQYVQALLSHAVSAEDGDEVLYRALDSLAGNLEKQKFGATSKPRPRPCSSAGKRYIPKHVRHAVWKRDQGQCTFVGDTGHRCGATRFLQLDHIDPVARGGEATVEGIRLRCRAHNQYEAERIFGTGFMQEKRNEARRVAAARAQAAKSEARARAEADARTSATTQQARDVLAALRELGYRAEQARRAVEFTEDLYDATLEHRVRAALKYLCPKATRRAPAAGDAPRMPSGVDLPAQAVPH